MFAYICGAANFGEWLLHYDCCVGSPSTELLPSVCPPESSHRTLNMRRYIVDGLVVKNARVWVACLLAGRR